MTLTEIPAKLTYQGQEYQLDIEENDTHVTLTYEHDPVRDDTFLIATFADNINAATDKMKRLLRIEKLI
jgi:hypothetical protein